jgi:hypothetical protein
MEIAKRAGQIAFGTWFDNQSIKNIVLDGMAQTFRTGFGQTWVLGLLDDNHFKPPAREQSALGSVAETPLISH